MESILKVGNGVQKHTYQGTKASLKGRKPFLFVKFAQFPCSCIRIRIPNTHPDPGQATPQRCSLDISSFNPILHVYGRQ
jgi:hypothetical protein